MNSIVFVSISSILPSRKFNMNFNARLKNYCLILNDAQSEDQSRFNTSNRAPKVVSLTRKAVHGTHFHSILSPKPLIPVTKTPFGIRVFEQKHQRCIIFVDENTKQNSAEHPHTPRLPIQYQYPQQ